MKKHYHGRDKFREINRDFHCAHCKQYVSSDYLLSGVQNRNHCPHCLWSRHMDLYKAGDRLSACRGQMRPVGLTLKRRFKRYELRPAGELMLVHQCTGCGEVSINRIAADDNENYLLAVYEESIVRFEGDIPLVRSVIDDDNQDIRFLQAVDREVVRSQLFGSYLCEN